MRSFLLGFTNYSRIRQRSKRFEKVDRFKTTDIPRHWSEVFDLEHISQTADGGVSSFMDAERPTRFKSHFVGTNSLKGWALYNGTNTL